MAVTIVEEVRAKQGYKVGPDGAVVEVINSSGEFTGLVVDGTPNVGVKAKGRLTVGLVSDGDYFQVGDNKMVFSLTGTAEEGETALDISSGTKTQASVVLAVLGVPEDGETLDIGGDIYEIDTDASVEAGNIAVTLDTSVAATGSLSFSGAVSDGETVSIGEHTYEFDTDGSVTEGNHRVWVGENTAAGAAIIALAAIINRENSETVKAVDGPGDTLSVEAVVSGESGNGILVGTTCANATWGVGVTSLEGGTNPSIADIVTAIVTASGSGTVPLTFIAGEGEQAGTILITATAGEAADGSAGNALAVSSTSSALVFSSSTLSGGADATSAEAIALITAETIENITMTAGTGDDEGTVLFTYNIPTAAANEISTIAVGDNLSWTADTLLDGVTPTVYTEATSHCRVMVDDNYMYIGRQIGENFVWKYVALSTLSAV